MAQPSRGLLLVRPVDTDETLPGARILLVAETRERMTAWQCEVVGVGSFAGCDDEDCERWHMCAACREWYRGLDREFECGPRVKVRVHPHQIKEGNWLLVRPRSFIAGPNPNVQEWFVHQDDVLAILSEE